MPFNRPIPESKQRGKLSGGIAAWAQAEKMMQIALILPCAAFIGWLGGAWIGSRLHQPWIGLVGIVFGGVSGLVYVVRLALASVGDSENGTGTEGGKGKGNSDKP